MCNLYSMTKGQAAIRNLFKVDRDSVGNLPPMPGIFPDYPAPIVRNADGGRELTMARWGMPSSSQALFEATKKRAAKLEAKGKQVDFKALLKVEPDKGTTNIRNLASPHWKPWHGVEHRCIVPMSSFSEFNRDAGGDIWFAFSGSRPLTCLTGLWTTYILAAQSDEMRKNGETLIRQADKLAIESWNERMWSSGEPIDPSPHRPSHQRRLDVDTCKAIFA